MSDEPVRDLHDTGNPDQEAEEASAGAEAVTADGPAPEPPAAVAEPATEPATRPTGEAVDAAAAPPLATGGAEAGEAVPPPRPEKPREPARRSSGRITRIQPDGTAWVADFRPLGREVMVRLRNAWQANPGQILEYELRRAAGGGNRWSGIDTVFNHQLDLGRVLALDEGRGLSAEGLAWLQAAIAHDPGTLRRVFSADTSLRLKQQLLEADRFPLPRALLLAALAHPRLSGPAARRLLAGPLRSPMEAARLLAAAGPRDEERLAERVAREHGDWLLEPLDLPESGRLERVLRWWRRTGERRWLLQLPAAEIPAAAALSLLVAGVFGNVPELPVALAPAEAAAWQARLDAAQRRRLLEAAFQDPARAALEVDPFQDLGTEFRDVLTALAGDPRWGEEARARLLERAELTPAAALDLLRQGAEGEARARLVALLASAPAHERPDPGPELALSLFREAQSENGEDEALLDWIGGHPAVQAQVEGWLAEAETRELGLRALCRAGEFSRARVQRLLALAMSPTRRAALVAAISRVSPERWSERHLLSDEERALWVAAGAPLP